MFNRAARSIATFLQTNLCNRLQFFDGKSHNGKCFTCWISAWDVAIALSHTFLSQNASYKSHITMFLHLQFHHHCPTPLLQQSSATENASYNRFEDIPVRLHHISLMLPQRQLFRWLVLLSHHWWLNKLKPCHIPLWSTITGEATISGKASGISQVNQWKGGPTWGGQPCNDLVQNSSGRNSMYIWVIQMESNILIVV